MGGRRTALPYGGLPRATSGAALSEFIPSLYGFGAEDRSSRYAIARFALHAGRHAVAERNRQACCPQAPRIEIPASRSRIEPRVWFSSPQYAELYPTTALAGCQRIRSLNSSFHFTYLLVCRAVRASCDRFHAVDIMA